MLLYLHGFASSPGSLKARVFRRRLAELGEELVVPELDGGDFEHLTLSRQLALVDRIARGVRPLALIGSSMGGYLSALHASRADVDALVLMAPAVDFRERWREKIGEADLEKWRRDGVVEVDHVALGRKMPLRFDLMVDAALHEPWPVVRCPTLVFQGTKDDIVPPERVKKWVAATPTARLVMLESGHELTDCAEQMAEEALRFLAGIPGIARAHPGIAPQG